MTMNPVSVRKLLTLGFTRWELAMALTVIGVHLAVFSYAGSPLPYYDQWVMEFNDTLMSILPGNGIAVLIFRHNGHLLATTKILTILGYFINGYWDVPFLVLCSVAVRALTAAWTFQLIGNSARPGTKAVLWLLCVMIFAAPYSGFNFLNGMQVSFYLVDCALLWSLLVTTTWTSPVSSGLALIGGTLFGVVSFASATAIPASTLAAHFFLRKIRPGFWPAWTISVVLVLGFIATGQNKEAIDAHFSLPHLQSVAHFWLKIISWPTDLATVGALLTVLCPIAVLVALTHARSRCRTPAVAVVVGLGVYAALNAALIAINRDPSQWHMRHWDTIALLPLAMLALGLHLADLNTFRRPALLVTCVIALCYVFFAGNLIRTVSWPYIKAAHDNRQAAINHYRTLLLQQDLRVESERINTLLENRDYAFFDDPIGRLSLHPVVLENLLALHRRPLIMLSPEIIPIRSPSRFSGFTQKLIAYGWLLCPVGSILGIIAMRREQGRTNMPPNGIR